MQLLLRAAVLQRVTMIAASEDLTSEGRGVL